MNVLRPDFPPDGSAISFSAGTQRPNPEKWRIVQPNGREKLACLISRFPELQTFVSTSPVLINAYPALFSPPGSVIFVDTHGRWQTFCAALSLAAQYSRPCIISAMPLTLAHLLLCALQRVTLFPKHILLLSGGYYCPHSLELYILELLRRAGVSAQVLHLYGVGEIDAGLLATQRTALSSDLLFQPIDPKWQPVIINGMLGFRHTTQPAAIASTDDAAEITEQGIRLHVNSHRLSLDICNQLEGWSHELWERRTGFLARKGSQIVFQCRSGTNPIPNHNEYEHFDFTRHFGHSWLDKPDWGQSII